MIKNSYGSLERFRVYPMIVQHLFLLQSKNNTKIELIIHPQVYNIYQTIHTILMRWIFDDCIDQYGNCIRQYSIFVSSFIIFIISLFAFIKVYRGYYKTLQFQLIPLGINTISTLAICFTQTQQEQSYTQLLLLIIEIYSYSLLSYAYIKLYLKGIKDINPNTIQKFHKGFLGFSIVALILLVGLAVYLGISGFKCEQKQASWWYLGFVILQIPIYACTFYFICRTNAKIKEIQDSKDIERESLQLLNHEDMYIRIKYKQTNLTIASFTISLILHISVTILLFVYPIECQQNRYLIVKKPEELITLLLANIANLFPHLIMPIIFYFLPAYYSRRGKSVRMEGSVNFTKYEQQEYFSRIETEQKLRNKYEKNYKH